MIKKLLALYILYELKKYIEYRGILDLYNNTTYSSDIYVNKSEIYKLLCILYKQIYNKEIPLHINFEDFIYFNNKIHINNIYKSVKYSFNINNINNKSKKILNKIIYKLYNNIDNNKITNISNEKICAYKYVTLKTTYIPQIFNIIFNITINICKLYSKYNNFNNDEIIYNNNKLKYIYKKSNTKNNLPIIFIHGVGLGPYIYTNFLNNFDTNIIAIEIPFLHITNTNDISYYNFCKSVELLLYKHNLGKDYILISHSIGTKFSLIIINNNYNIHKPKYLILLDPICFLHNFISYINFTLINYRNIYELYKNNKINKLYYLSLILTKTFILNNINLQYFMFRYLHYAPYITYIQKKENIKTLVCMSEKDFLYNDSEKIIKYIKTNYKNIKLINYKHYNHGEFLINNIYKKEIIKDITNFIK